MFTSIIFRQSSVRASATGPIDIMPALLTKMSSPPNASAVLLASSRTWFSCVTSVCTARAEPPREVIMLATAVILSSLLPASTTRVPAPARATAVASPMPEEAPVTTATRPASQPPSALTGS